MAAMIVAEWGWQAKRRWALLGFRAQVASTLAGLEGGHILVDRTADAIQDLWR